jgi:GT2 family glycosyltransferase
MNQAVPGSAERDQRRLSDRGVPRAEAPRATIVVTGWRSAPLLVPCLDSIARQATEVPFEVVVALNDPDESLLRIVERVEGVTVVASRANVGFGGACNRGVAAGSGEYVVLLNDDTEVLAGWLDALVAAADSDDLVGAVGSVNVNPDGSLQQAGAIIWREGLTTTVSQQVVDLLEQPFDVTALRPVDYCGASSLLVRRSLWDHVGGFDESYFPAYFEDVDLALRVEQAGMIHVCQPASTVIHRAGTSTTSRLRHFLAARNHERLLRQWSGFLVDHEPFAPEDPAALGRALNRPVERARRIRAGGAPRAGSRPSAGDDGDEAGQRQAAADVGHPAGERAEVEILESFARFLEERCDEGERAHTEAEARLAATSHLLDDARAERDRLQAEHRRLEIERDDVTAQLQLYARRRSVRVTDALARVYRRVASSSARRWRRYRASS